jgi:hypothetical protein
MANIKLSESLIGREVERLFSETPGSHGGHYENPVTGGRFVYGLDPIGPQKKEACRALLAREWFAVNGPADAPQLPITYEGREYLKWCTGRPLDYVVAQFARSLGTHYDVTEHPPFSEFVSGLVWDHCNGGSELPLSREGLAELKRRYPPQKLEGLSSYSWSRPTRKNRKRRPAEQSGSSSRAESKRLEPAKLHQSALEHTKPNAASQEAARRAAAAFAERCYGPPEN